MASGRSRRFIRWAFRAAIIIAIPTLVSIQPGFAENFGSDEYATDPCGLSAGSHLGANRTLELPQIAGSALAGGPTLAPAPTEQLAPAPTEQMEPESPPMLGGGFMPEPARDFSERSVNPSIPATSPMLTPPPGTMARPGAGLYSPIR
jgi:hypothetical protein